VSEAEAGRAREYKSRFYAVYVTGGTEERTAIILYNRALTLGLDVRSIVVPVDIKGAVFVEVGNVGDLYDLIRGVKNVKRRRPVLVQPEDVVRLAAPRVEIPQLERGMVVEITGGPFRGMKGRIIEVYEGRGEVDVVLLESDFQMAVTVPMEYVRPVEEA